jgi:hypothetical protein
MQSFLGGCANSHDPTRIHPALNCLADECCGMLAHLVAYVGALALLAIVGIHLWDELAADAAVEPPGGADWSVALRSHPAFAVGQFDLPEKTAAYEIHRASRGWPQGDLSLNGSRSKAGPAAAVFEPADPARGWKRAETGRIIHRAELKRAILGSKPGERCGEPPAARHDLIEAASQDAGFHATFSRRAALL